MENLNNKKDRRSITSPINGRKGGRPRVWNVDPYKALQYCKANPSPENNETAKMLKRMIDNRRNKKQKEQLSKIHKRTDLALKQIEYQKKLRTKKLAELRYTRMLIRKMLTQLEELDAKDLDFKRTKTGNAQKEVMEEDVF